MKASRPGLADLRRLRDDSAADHESPHTRKTRARRRPAAESADAPRAPGRPLPGPAPTPAAGVVLTSPHEAARPPVALNPDDRALFRLAMRFVKPLAHHGNRVLAPARPIPEALLRARREQAQGTDVSPAPPPGHRVRRRPPGPPDPEASEFLQPGCGTDLLRGLRRGRWLPQAILDLHGSTEDEAHERLDRFIDSCADNGVRCVRIVHGKGMGSRHGTPVLKSAVRVHLCRLAAVQAWVQCAEPDGGAGAVTALLHVRPDTAAR